MATVPLATYLWTRIHQMGVDSIMGVPGDFNLNFLDHIFFVPGLKWVGNSNELNAAYAADGYARIKGAPGCIVTTHGVGELSAINGIAAASAEHVPVIHVVGQTPMASQDKHLMIHHSLGFHPDHQVFNKVSKPIRHSAAELASAEDPTAEIDRVLRDCVIYRKPVYIYLPIDKTDQPVSSSLLEQSIDVSLPVDKKNEEAAVHAIIEALYSSKNASIFIDYLAIRYAQDETRNLVRKLDLPYYSSQMGKGCVDENSSRFVGIYNGSVSAPGVAEAIESSDLFISIGWLEADTNTAFFSRKITMEKNIDIWSDHVTVQGKRFDNVYMASLIEQLISTIDVSKLVRPQTPEVGKLPPAEEGTAITHAYLWDRLASIFRPGDAILAETGTTSYAFSDLRFPEDVKYISQSYYMSIGFAGPASVGADIALEELHQAGKTKQRGRTILAIGDGSLMLTLQEVSNMVLKKLPILMIIVNNAGYTIERAIHGARQPYNDIPYFNYAHLLPLFTAPDSKDDLSLNYHVASTREELESILKIDRVVNPKEIQVLEIRLDPFDLPWKLIKALNIRNPGYLKREGFPHADTP